MYKNIRKFHDGFTILEIVISSFLVIGIVSITATLVRYIFSTYTFSIDEQQSISQAQYGLTLMLREIRGARTAETGAWALEQTDDNTLVFFSDVTGDGKTDRVRYFMDGTTLKRGLIQPTDPPVTYPADQEQTTTVASYVDNSGQAMFTYYNGSWPIDTQNNPLPAVSRIIDTRYITIYLRIHPNPSTSTQPFVLTSGAEIRSLKNNL